MTDTHYLRAGKWTRCAHCGTVNVAVSDHYCGAPWQTQSVGDDLSQIPPAWAAALIDAQPSVAAGSGRETSATDSVVADLARLTHRA